MPTPAKRIALMAHRGWPTRYPENTLLGFQKALEWDVQILEFDVRLTRDGALVVIHDATVDRTTNGKGNVGDFSLEGLRALDAGSWKHPDFAGLPVPTLAEALDLAAAHPALVLNVEIKDFTEHCARATVETLRLRGLLARCVLTCFDAGILHYLKERDASVRVQGFPERFMKNVRPGSKGTTAILDYVGIPVGDATPELVAGYRARGTVPGVWCVDDLAALERVRHLDIDIITTNAPDVVAPALA